MMAMTCCVSRWRSISGRNLSSECNHNSSSTRYPSILVFSASYRPVKFSNEIFFLGNNPIPVQRGSTGKNLTSLDC
jgi:hypothetical protein